VLASGSSGGTLRLWDINKQEFFQLLNEKQQTFFSSGFHTTWSHSGESFAAASSDSLIRLWDSGLKRITRVVEGHRGAVHCTTFSHDDRLLASKSADGTVQFWNCDTWANVAVLDEPIYKLTPLDIAFHPSAPVLATLGEGGTAIRIWDLDYDVILGAAPEREDVFYTTAKITLVGDSGVGKTGLGWHLSHGSFKEHPSTHGQQFWVVDELGATREDGTQCEAVLWDLAGQPDYRLVHALFLDDVDLALVLFDPANRQEPLKGVEYWLKQLSRERRDGRKRRMILVGARADRGAPTLPQQELEEFCKQHGIESYVRTSALTGEGLKDLLARVKASIVWDEMPATVTTKTFKRIKEFVLGLKESSERKGVLVSPGELRARLEATDAGWEFTDAEMMTAVRHLSNHGYVSVLRGSNGEETILLAPDLLANLAASFVIEARRNPRGLGALEEARVLKGGYEFQEIAVLDERERDVLLDAAAVLFLEHNLCFRETLGEQTFLIFPALINQKRPLLEEVETVDDVSYRVTGAVENVYAALVVQLGYTRNFTRTNQWQNQAEYETARGDVCGFRQVEEREGEAELVLYYAEEKAGARLLFQGLFEEFLRGRDVSVTKFPPVPCPKCGYRQQRGEVVKRIGEGKGFLFCGECGKKITLPKVGEEVALSRVERVRLNQEQERARRRTAFESALVRVKAIARDEKKASPSCFISYAWGDEEQERWVRGFAKHFENAGVEVVLDRKDNPQIGANVARFVSRIEQTDFVVVVGTPSYRRKYENEVSDTGSVVAAEVNLINLRLIGTNEEADTVLPVLLEGDERSSLPPLARGKVYGSFLQETLYFATLFDLILTLYRISFEHPAVSDLRDSLRAGPVRWG
jgi:small GTP-binding protein